jgi:hypothetical protein
MKKVILLVGLMTAMMAGGMYALPAPSCAYWLPSASSWMTLEGGNYWVGYDNNLKSSSIRIKYNSTMLYLYETQNPRFFNEIKTICQNSLAGRMSLTNYYNYYGQFRFGYDSANIIKVVKIAGKGY